MYKEYQIFEILQNDINASINESLGISDAVSSETNRVCKIIEDEILKSEKKLIASGVGYKCGEKVIDVFNEHNTVKELKIPPVTISFRWEYYNFRDNQYKAYFLKKNTIITGGKSVLIINPYRKTNDKGFISVVIFALSGKINQNDFIDTIGHELRHILECDIPKKQFSNMSLNATVKNNLYCQNYYSRLIANILYLIDKYEISGFMQGFYEFINKEKWNYGSVDAAVEHSESYNLMMSLKEKIIEAEKLMTDDKFIEGVDAYKNYGINHNNFLKIANGRYHEIISRIGKAIVKAKQDFLKEGLHVDFGDYFHFHSSFFRKK